MGRRPAVTDSDQPMQAPVCRVNGICRHRQGDKVVQKLEEKGSIVSKGKKCYYA